MSVVFTLTEAQWQDLVRRMYGEGVLESALGRGDGSGITVSGTVEDLMLFLSHIAELVEDRDHSPIDAMDHLRYLIDKVVRDLGRWRVLCVQVQS